MHKPLKCFRWDYFLVESTIVQITTAHREFRVYVTGRLFQVIFLLGEHNKQSCQYISIILDWWQESQIHTSQNQGK